MMHHTFIIISIKILKLQRIHRKIYIAHEWHKGDMQGLVNMIQFLYSTSSLRPLCEEASKNERA